MLTIIVFKYFTHFYLVVILSWLVDYNVAETALKGDELIEEENIECRPEKIPCSILDENVDVYLVRHYFTVDAWMLVEDVIKQKKEIDIWLCSVCQKDVHCQQSIICESCMNWYHFTCVGLNKTPKRKNWFCKYCSFK